MYVNNENIRKKEVILVVTLIMSFILFSSFALSLDFYKEDIEIKSITTNIDVGESRAFVHSVINLEGEGTVVLRYNDIGEEVEIVVDGEESVSINRYVSLERISMPSLSFNPLPLVDDKYYSKSIENIKIYVLLPENIEEASSSGDFSYYMDDNRTGVYFEFIDSYNPEIVLSWISKTDLDFNIELDKEEYKIGEDIEIKINIINNGDNVENLNLESYMPSEDLEGVSPAEEFEIIEEEGSNDPSLYWSHIESIANQETKQVIFKVKSKNQNAQLGEIKISSDNELIEVLELDSIIVLEEEVTEEQTITANIVKQYKQENPTQETISLPDQNEVGEGGELPLPKIRGIRWNIIIWVIVILIFIVSIVLIIAFRKQISDKVTRSKKEKEIKQVKKTKEKKLEPKQKIDAVKESPEPRTIKKEDEKVSQINELIAQGGEAIANDNIAEARAIYNQIQEVYAQIKDGDEVIYNEIMEFYKKLSEKK